MAAHTGYLMVDAIHAEGAGYVAVTRDAPPLGAGLASLVGGAVAPTSGLPTGAPLQEFDGYRHDSYGMLDFYNRLHFSTLEIDLGNVVTAQERTIEVWNAYLEERTLYAVNVTSGDGITFTPPATIPFAFQPLEELTFTWSISTEGPGTVSALYAFDFDAEDVVVTLVGSRITPWTFVPDWSRGITERLEWLTNVTRNYDGSEQRAGLRTQPRRSVEFSFLAEDRNRQFMEAVLWGWGARPWAVPFWPDGAQLTATLSAGASSIPIATADTDYHAGGLAMILRDPVTYEVVEVQEVEANELVLARETIEAWGAGDWVFPVRIGQLPDRVSLSRFTGAVSRGTARFQFLDTNEVELATGETTYRGAPVLTHRPNWIADPEADFERKLSWLDGRVGAPVIEDEAAMPATRQSHRWTLTSKAEVTAFRKFLAARRGRLGSIWVPTWAQDLTVKAAIGALATAIDVTWAGYQLHLWGDANRKDVRIELWDGTVFYRRITGVSQVDETTERLSIDSALGENVAVADVAMVSFMALCRLDADAVELAHWTGEVVQSAASWRSFRHGL